MLGDAAAAASALSPMRRAVLAALAEPDSATGVARRLDLPRQKVNYHLRVLEDLGLVELVEERQRRGRIERIVRRTATDVVLDPGLVEAADRTYDGEQGSAAALVAAAADAIRAVGKLMARDRDVPVPTATVVVDVRFAKPSDVRAFAEEFAQLCARYDRPRATKGRRFRVALLAHPHDDVLPDDRHTNDQQKENGDG